MRYAFCKSDNKQYSARDFEKLPDDELQEKRASLFCVECKERAWFTRSTQNGIKDREAYFNSHHKEGCSQKTSYVLVEDERDAAPSTTETVTTADEIAVNLDEKKGGVIADLSNENKKETSDDTDPSGTRNVKGLAGKNYTNKDKTLRQVLASLVRYQNFRFSDKKIRFYSSAGAIQIDGIVRNEIVNFDDFKPSEGREHKIYWGLIVTANKSSDGTIWLNAGDSKKELSIKIFPDKADEFIDAFKIKNLEELNGAHVIVVGRSQVASTGKPIIYCANTNFINLQRYKEEYLEV
ncbi:hypothetical protein WCX18_07640 [Sulfurimonas sp. HSL1-2]|uniref:hypothetical protein n=1 Tax=Thiomicrolovo zhangzhouensis TaxID=3131933 RepID=UPI0031F938F9